MHFFYAIFMPIDPFEKLLTGPLLVTFHKALRDVCLQLLSTACSAQTINAEAQNNILKYFFIILKMSFWFYIAVSTTFVKAGVFLVM